MDRMYICHFRQFRQNPPSFGRGKSPFAKNPVCVLPKSSPDVRKVLRSSQKIPPSVRHSSLWFFSLGGGGHICRMKLAQLLRNSYKICTKISLKYLRALVSTPPKGIGGKATLIICMFRFSRFFGCIFVLFQYFAAIWGLIRMFRIHSGRKLLPTDASFVRINSVRTYRYRYRSVIVLNQFLFRYRYLSPSLHLFQKCYRCEIPRNYKYRKLTDTDAYL